MNISGVFNSSNVQRLWYPVGEIVSSLSGTQSVRWRKGRWMPTAPSKLFWVPTRCVVPKEEEEEMKRLYNRYRTEMKAVRLHLQTENLLKSETSELASQKAIEEEEEHQRLMDFNLHENKRVAGLRERRLHEEQEADLARVIASKEKLEQDEILMKEEGLRIISEAQELVKTFIQREDLEKAIETALENPKEFNFAMDADGYIYRGRTRSSGDGKEEKEHLMSVSQ